MLDGPLRRRDMFWMFCNVFIIIFVLNNYGNDYISEYYFLNIIANILHVIQWYRSSIFFEGVLEIFLLFLFEI